MEAKFFILFLILMAFGNVFAQGMLVTKILEHKVFYDSPSGKVVHIVKNLYKYNLTNVTIIDSCGEFRKKFILRLLLPQEEKRIEYIPKISQNCTLVSKTFYWLEGNQHELVEKKINITVQSEAIGKEKKHENNKKSWIAIYFGVFLPLFVVVLFLRRKRKKYNH